MHFCYALVADAPTAGATRRRRTYVGYTVDPRRRLRQHNGDLCGGARATRGRRWTHLAVVAGFQTQQQGLQFEWAWKFWTRKRRWRGPTGRVRALHHVLQKPRWTRQAPDAASVPLRVVLRDRDGGGRKLAKLLLETLTPPLPPHVSVDVVPADAWPWPPRAPARRRRPRVSSSSPPEVGDPPSHGVAIRGGDAQVGTGHESRDGAPAVHGARRPGPGRRDVATQTRTPPGTTVATQTRLRRNTVTTSG